MDYSNVVECADRLTNEMVKHGNVCIAFDFDNTLYDYHGIGVKNIQPCIDLLKRCQNAGVHIVIWTVRQEGKDTQEVVEYLKGLGITKYLINEVPPEFNIKPGCRKPFFSLYLDDRAGLGHAMRTLSLFLVRLGF